MKNFLVSLALYVFIFGWLFGLCSGYASYYETSCSKGTTAGSSIMGASAVNAVTRTVRVYRNGVQITSGFTYQAGESLTVDLSNTGGEFCFVATGATFPGGGCSGSRTTDNGATLVMPQSGSVSVKALFASSQSTVSITPMVTLTLSAVTASPTATPTAKPSANPTPIPTATPSAVPTTHNPTAFPTVSPTVTPTAAPTTASPTAQPSTASPTAEPTTATPTAVPTAMPTAAPTAGPTFAAGAPTPVPTTPYPTAHPTVSPTGSPTSSPSYKPSGQPSGQPTGNPTAYPTTEPTSDPTNSPTPRPTTATPTVNPTGQPSSQPSSLPSSHPVFYPTSIPTSFPNTTSTGGYVIQSSFVLDDVSISDIDNMNVLYDTLTDSISIALNKPITITDIRDIESNKRYVRVLSTTGLYVGFVIKSITLQTDAVNVGVQLRIYLNSTEFISTVQTVAPTVTSISGITTTEVAVNDDPVISNYDFSCALGSDMILEWSIDSNSVVHTLFTVSDSEKSGKWISSGLVSSFGSMVPSDESKRHSVYKFDSSSGTAFYYKINGYTALEIIRNFNLPSSKIEYIQSGFGKVQMALQFDEVDPSGTDILLYAYGVHWPIKHYAKGRGFKIVTWKDGTCSDPVYPFILSPYIVFASLLLPLIFTQILMPLAKYYPNGGLRSFVDFVTCYKMPSHIICGDMSVGGAFMIVVHWGLCAAVGTTTYYYAAVGSTVFNGTPSSSDPIDTRGLIKAIGMIALMNYWVVLLPTSQTSIWTRITTVSYERSIKYHKLLAITAVACSLVHFFINYAYTKRYRDTFMLTTGYLYNVIPLFGFLALLAFGTSSVFAIDFIRNKLSFEWFKITHKLNIAGIIFLMLHLLKFPMVFIGFIPGVLLHIYDGIRRVYFTLVLQNVTNVQVYGKKDQVYTKLEIQLPPSNTPGYQFGGYYFLCIPTISKFQWHPVSVCAYREDSAGQYVSFVIKAMKGQSWTQQLSIQEKGGLNSVGSDGCYGNLSVDLKKYQRICIICGGIGVTPMIVLMEQIIKQIQSSKIANGVHPFPELQCIEFHWSLRGITPLFTDVFKEQLNGLHMDSSFVKMDTDAVPDLEKFQDPINIGAIITSEAVLGDSDIATKVEGTVGDNRAGVDSIRNKLLLKLHLYDTSKACPDSDHISSSVYNGNIKITHGRPDIDTIITNHASSISCILTCGPTALTEKVWNQAYAAGIAIHQETFGY